MTGRDWIKDHIVHIILTIMMVAVTEGTLILFQESVSVQLCVISYLVLVLVSIACYDYFRIREFYRHYEQSLKKLDKKYLIAELMKEPSFLQGRILKESLEDITKSMNDEINKHGRINEEFKQFVNIWVHEIKIPIAGMKLIVHNHKEGSARTLNMQIQRIDTYVEQVLYYLRSEVPQQDYVIQAYSLEEMIGTVIKDNRDSLILEHFSVENKVDNISVYTDKKWFSYILGQIISNGVKYAGMGNRVIRFTTRQHGENVTLEIWDNGMGIDQKDLPRIFEKSYTGSNGHQTTASTGMGLYICQKLCQELGHSIQAESQKGAYTRILVTMRAKVILQ